MASYNKERDALEQIKTWVERHPMTDSSKRGADWLLGGRQKRDFSDTNIVDVGIYAFRRAESAIHENERLRELLNEPPLSTPYEVQSHFADVNKGDLDPKFTMITEDNTQMADYDVIDDPRHLRTIAVWANIYRRALHENKLFHNEYRALMRTQAWFESTSRRGDRLGLQSNELDEPRYYDPECLKKLVFYGRDIVLAKRKYFVERVVEAQQKFPGRIRIPDLNSRVFQVLPKANPDLLTMAPDAIYMYDLDPEREGDSEHQKKRKRRQRRCFFQSLAILAWTMHEIERAGMEVGRDLRAMRARYH